MNGLSKTYDPIHFWNRLEKIYIMMLFSMRFEKLDFLPWNSYHYHHRTTRAFINPLLSKTFFFNQPWQNSFPSASVSFALVLFFSFSFLCFGFVSSVLLSCKILRHYASQSLTEVERRYLQTEHEALAVVWGSEHFQLFLQSLNFSPIIIIKHYFKFILVHQSLLQARIERWVLHSTVWLWDKIQEMD